jgi:hypothetical protein
MVDVVGSGSGVGVLDPGVPGSWAGLSSEVLFSLPAGEVERVQVEALGGRFAALRGRVEALDNLASRQGVDRVSSIEDAVPVLFDHRVYKSYPLSLVEQRRFDRLTGWLARLSTHDLSSVDVAGLDSVDAWLMRLGDYGMSVGHTTGTSGKLSFLPRSVSEGPAFVASYVEMLRGLFGVDLRVERLPSFLPSYRRPFYAFGVKLGPMYREALGNPETYVAHDYEVSADLISLAGRLGSAEERGQLDKLAVDARLLKERDELLERGRHREAELDAWLRRLSEEFRGRRVWLVGTAADQVKAMVRAEELGIRMDLSPDSILYPGGGLKGYQAPEDWRKRLMAFYGVDRMYSSYGMTECLGYAPGCEHGFYHFYPYTLPIVLDDDFAPLPRVGVQTGRMALFDFLAESFWGGYITGDRVTMYWDSDCACGRQGPRIGQDIMRFSELEGGQDDKISCAGSADAYNAFMDFVAEI